MRESALDKLTPKQALFAQEYPVDKNGTAAAIRAGYSKTTAKQQASRLLTKVDMRAAIAELQRATADKLEITKELIIKTLWRNHELALEGNPVLDRYGHLTGEHIRQIAPSNRALEQISELLGYKMDRKSVVVLGIAKMCETELAEQEAELLHMKAELEAKKKAGTVH